MLKGESFQPSARNTGPSRKGFHSMSTPVAAAARSMRITDR